MVELRNGMIALTGSRKLSFDTLNTEEREFLLGIARGTPITSSDQRKFDGLVSRLQEHGFLIEAPDWENESPRFSRQLDYLSGLHPNPDLLQERIENLKLLVIGCGGTGAMITQSLIGHGVKEFVLVDMDSVQPSNLNRQLFFSESDINAPKVEALARSIQKLQNSAKVSTMSERINCQELVRDLVDTHKPDLVLCGADTPPMLIQQWIVQGTLAQDVPVMLGGVGLRDLSIGPLLDSAEPKEQFLAWLQKSIDSVVPSSLQPVRASLASTNAIASSFMTFEIFKFFSSRDRCRCLNRRLIFDLDGYEVTKEVSFDENDR